MSLSCSVRSRCMAKLSFSVTQQSSLCFKTLAKCLQRLSSPPRISGVEPPFSHYQIISNFSTFRPLDYRRVRRSGFLRSSNYIGVRNESVENRHVREHNLFNPTAGPAASVKRDIERKEPSTLGFGKTNVADLERELLWLIDHSSPGVRLRNLLDHLIVTRHIRPTTIHYEALILLNLSPDQGAAENVRMLLEEMEEHKIPASSTTYTAVLRVMTVHPDTDMVVSVLESCSKAWIEIDLEMLHLISATYLQAGMTELALDYLEQVESVAKSSDNKVELWLYVLFIRKLAVAEDWDGVMRMCYRLNDDSSLNTPLAMRQVDVPYEFWQWLLEVAVEARDVWLTVWIWKLWVVRQWIQPGPQLCMRIIGIVADAGLTDAAESIRAYFICMSSIDDWKDRRKDTKDWVRNTSFMRLLEEDQLYIRKHLDLAYQNAGKDPTSLDAQKQRVSHALWWQTLAKAQEETGEFGGRRQFDPWAYLDDETDPGRSWARVLRERSKSEENLEMQREQAAEKGAKAGDDE